MRVYFEPADGEAPARIIDEHGKEICRATYRDCTDEQDVATVERIMVQLVSAYQNNGRV